MDVDELYLTPPERFVAARNALAKSHPEVKSLKRPTPSAWLLNVLARKHEKALETVFRAGAELQSAQDRVLAGESADLIQTATRELRSVIARAIDECRAILVANGRKEDEAVLKNVSSILRAASVDAQLRASVSSGRLLADPVEDEEESLLEQLAAAPVAKPAPAKDDQKEREEKAQKEREEKAREREKKRALAKQAFEDARRIEDEARDSYVSAEDELLAARQALEIKELTFKRAEERLTKATDARKAASDALDRCE